MKTCVRNAEALAFKFHELRHGAPDEKKATRLVCDFETLLGRIYGLMVEFGNYIRRESLGTMNGPAAYQERRKMAGELRNMESRVDILFKLQRNIFPKFIEATREAIRKKEEAIVLGA
jgi:hypothetical protein